MHLHGPACCACCALSAPLTPARACAVPLKVIAKFNRIKALAGASGGAIAALAAALACSGALEVSAEGARVRRRAPLPELAPREALERTVIADNLPDPLSIGDAPACLPARQVCCDSPSLWPLVPAARPQGQVIRNCWCVPPCAAQPAWAATGLALEPLLGNARARQRPAPHTHDSEQGADGAEDAMALFGRAGSVAMVRICPPGSGPKSTAQLVWGADLAVSNQVCRAHNPAPCSTPHTSDMRIAWSSSVSHNMARAVRGTTPSKPGRQPRLPAAA